MNLAQILTLVLPCLVAAASLGVARLKHSQHGIMAELLEEALVLERERASGTPLAEILGDAATSQATKDTLAAITLRVEARLAKP